MLMSVSRRYGDWWSAVALLVLGALLGFAFLNSRGTDDAPRWIMYVDLARQHGLLGEYSWAVFQGIGGAPTTYPPLSLILLGMLAGIADFFHGTDFLVFKISLIPFVLGCACIAAVWRDRNLLLGVAMFLVLALNAFLLDYIDVYFIFFLLLSYYCLGRGWLGTAMFLFVVSAFLKWQPIILAPFVLLYVLARCRKISDLTKFLPAIALIVVVLALYGAPMWKAFSNGVTEPAISAKALNFNWLITAFVELYYWQNYWTPFGTVLRTLQLSQLSLFTQSFDLKVASVLLDLSTALRYLTYAVCILYFYVSDRSWSALLRASAIAFFAYCTFGMAVHENHACTAAVLALCLFAVDRSRWFEAAVIGIMFNVNQLIFYGINGSGLGFSRIVQGTDATIYLAAFSVVIFVAMWLPVAASAIDGLRKRVRPFDTSLVLYE